MVAPPEWLNLTRITAPAEQVEQSNWELPALGKQAEPYLMLEASSAEEIEKVGELVAKSKQELHCE